MRCSFWSLVSLFTSDFNITIDFMVFAQGLQKKRWHFDFARGKKIGQETGYLKERNLLCSLHFQSVTDRASKISITASCHCGKTADAE